MCWQAVLTLGAFGVALAASLQFPDHYGTAVWELPALKGIIVNFPAWLYYARTGNFKLVIVVLDVIRCIGTSSEQQVLHDPLTRLSCRSLYKSTLWHVKLHGLGRAELGPEVVVILIAVGEHITSAVTSCCIRFVLRRKQLFACGRGRGRRAISASSRCQDRYTRGTRGWLGGRKELATELRRGDLGR